MSSSFEKSGLPLNNSASQPVLPARSTACSVGENVGALRTTTDNIRLEISHRLIGRMLSTSAMTIHTIQIMINAAQDGRAKIDKISNNTLTPIVITDKEAR